MKTVKIPESATPWTCIVDGVKYTYPAGVTMQVPDQVAALVEAYNREMEEPSYWVPDAKVNRDPKSSAPFTIGADKGGVYRVDSAGVKKYVDADLPELTDAQLAVVAEKTQEKVGAEVNQLKEETSSLKGNVWNAITDGKCDNKGLIDCTEIVQKAINNAKDCTVLYFPKVSYFFKRNIIIEQKKGLTIRGDGIDWYGTAFVTSYAYSFMLFYGGKDLTVENLSIKGNDISTSKAIMFADNTPTTMDCRTTDTHIRHVKITRFATGIEVSCPSGYNYFDDVSVSMFPSSGIGFSIGSTYKNTGTTETGAAILPNYIYLTNCKVDGSSQEFSIDGLRAICGQYIVADKCDFCNMTNGVNIINYSDNNHIVYDVFINNTSLYNNANGVLINAKADGINRVAINGCMIVTSVGTNHYALAVYKEDAVKPVKNISFIGNIFRDYANIPRNFFNIEGADSESIVKIGLGC